MAVNNELEMMWKEAIMPRFKVLSRHFREGLRKIPKISAIKVAPAELRTENYTYKSQKLNRLSQDASSESNTDRMISE
jgi:hypothetical protein